MKIHLHFLCAALLLTGPGFLWADGGSTSTGGTSTGMSSRPAMPVDRFAAARNDMAAQKWPEAIAELQRIADPKNADWNNLMGYCSRRSEPPDLAAAERYYQAALAINPRHLGTLEYLGEMRLQQGNLSGAERELDSLRKATLFKSREFLELQQAIALYKTSGHYTPTE